MFHLFDSMAGDPSGVLTVSGNEVRHMHAVLRLAPGEKISASNGRDGKEYLYTIEEIGEERVICRMMGETDGERELPADIYLFQGIPKGEKMDLIVQKATELGVSEIIPVSMARCVARIEEKKAAKKTERWQKIAEAAAMQSKRTKVPQVKMPMGFGGALSYAERQAAVRVMPYELKKGMQGTKALLESVREKKSLAVFIGPEGGIEESEVRMAEEAGIVPVSLGNRILRTETAGLCILSWMVYILEVSV